MWYKSLKSINPWSTIFVVFFFTVLGLSFLVFKDYGVSTDEIIQAYHLRVTGKKVTETFGLLDRASETLRDVEDLDEYDHRFYGLAGQYPLLALEFFPDTFDPMEPVYWQIRHLYTRLLFIAAGVAMFFILKEITDSNLIVLGGLFLFFLHPRVSAHSFYNIKDSVFLSFFVFSMFFLFRYLKSMSRKDLAFFAVISAVTVNIRMMGLIAPAFLVLYLLVEFFRGQRSWKESLKSLLMLGLVFSSALYLIWPALWGDPVSTFRAGLEVFSRYEAWDGWILLGGRWISAIDTPFYYLPYWILVSSPWEYLLTWVLGLLLPVFYVVFKTVRGDLQRPDIFWASTFFIWGSYLAIVLLRSNLYSGWRHVQYLFGPLIVLSVYILDLVKKRFPKGITYGVGIMVSGLLILNIFWTVRNHPFQYTYFNWLAGEDWTERWEHDYWWLSAKQQLEWLLQNKDHEPLIVCGGRFGHIHRNYRILSPEEKERLTLDCSWIFYDDNVIQISEDAEFLSEDGEPLSRYLFFNQNIEGEKNLENFRKIHSTDVGGNSISRIYKAL